MRRVLEPPLPGASVRADPIIVQVLSLTILSALICLVLLRRVVLCRRRQRGPAH